MSLIVQFLLNLHVFAAGQWSSTKIKQVHKDNDKWKQEQGEDKRKEKFAYNLLKVTSNE